MRIKIIRTHDFYKYVSEIIFLSFYANAIKCIRIVRMCRPKCRMFNNEKSDEDGTSFAGYVLICIKIDGIINASKGRQKVMITATKRFVI